MRRVPKFIRIALKLQVAVRKVHIYTVKREREKKLVDLGPIYVMERKIRQAALSFKMHQNIIGFVFTNTFRQCR